MKKLNTESMVRNYVKRYFDLVGEDTIERLTEAVRMVNNAAIEALKDYVETNDDLASAYSVIVTDLHCKGLYDPKDNIVCIHPGWSLYYFDLVDADTKNLKDKIRTMLHEHRHAKQYTETMKYLRKYRNHWKKNIPEGQDDYYDDPLEIDARKYADKYVDEAYEYLINNIEEKIEEELMIKEALYGAFE